MTEKGSLVGEIVNLGERVNNPESKVPEKLERLGLRAWVAGLALSSSILIGEKDRQNYR